MTFLSKLWFGEYTLRKTYWIFSVLIPILLSIPIKIWSIGSNASLFFYLCFVSTYSFIALIGLWRSSGLYVGNAVWSLLARLTVIIGFISQFFLMIQTMLLDKSYPIWYLILVGTILFCFSLSVKKKELLGSVDANIKGITKKEVVDENILWEQVAKEFEFSRNEGLWARLFVESKGDDNKAKVKYLSLRFEELRIPTTNKISEPTNNELSEFNSEKIDTNVKDSENEEELKPPSLMVYIKLILVLIFIPFFLLFLAILIM